jgi:Flp pilus assembly protein TadD
LQQSQLAFARLSERRGQTDQAAAIYQGLIKKFPQDPAAFHRMGIIYVQQGKFAEAEEHFRTAKTLAPPTAELLSDIGYTYYLLQRLPEAEAALNQALALEPNHVAATNNLALLRGAQKRYDECLTLFKRVNREAEAHANLAYVLAENGELEQAENAYSYALSLDSNLRVAAKAMLQVSQRRQIESRVAAAKREPPPNSPADPRSPAPTTPPADAGPAVAGSAPASSSVSSPAVAMAPAPAYSPPAYSPAAYSPVATYAPSVGNPALR